MQYRVNPRNGDRISILGYGCMRFPRDEALVEEQIACAIENGVNYFDTAYIYPGSEATLGRVLKKLGARDRVNLATKLPPYLVNKPADLDRLFNTHLTRLQTDHIDYYLIHMLPNASEWQRLCALGIESWIANKKQQGQIRNIGFSYHGGLTEFKRLIDVGAWDFCMLQYNFYDENNQAGKEGLLYAAQNGLPVIVMEPLRGGYLANHQPQQALDIWKGAPIVRSPAEWALRWVWNHEQVLTVLSGMNSLDMVRENTRAADDAHANALTDEDLRRFVAVRTLLTERTKVPCTGCNYCMPCPFGVDIPLCFSCYNDMALSPSIARRFNYVFRANGHEASLCQRCGKCEPHCPQRIAIREELAHTAAAMERFPYKPMRAVVRRFMKLR